MPVVFCLPEYSSGCEAHDQHQKPGTVHDILRPFAKLVSRRNIFLEHFSQQWRYSCDCTADRRLGYAIGLRQFCLDAVAAHICQRHDHGLERSEDRRPIVRAEALDPLSGPSPTGQ